MSHVFRAPAQSGHHLYHVGCGEDGFMGFYDGDVSRGAVMSSDHMTLANGRRPPPLTPVICPACLRILSPFGIRAVPVFLLTHNPTEAEHGDQKQD